MFREWVLNQHESSERDGCAYPEAPVDSLANDRPGEQCDDDQLTSL